MKADKPLVLTDPALLEELTPRERAFVQHPLVTTDPRAAARDSGYSESFCNTHAYESARKLIYFIKHYAQQRMAATEVTQQKIIQELAAIAFADETAYFEFVDTPEGDTVKRVKDLKRLPPNMRAALKNVNFEFIIEGGVRLPHITSFTLHDKVPALKALAEYFGLRLGKSTGGNADESAGTERKLLENLTDDELEQVNAIFNTAASRTKAAVSKRRDAKAIEG